MASKKKTPTTDQLGLSLPAKPLAAPPVAASSVTPADLDRGEKVNLDDFDDYDDDVHEGEVPRLRLVDPPRPMPRVVVELIGADRFEVSRLRDNGTTVASVMWTRDELAELITRAASALKM